MTVVIRRPRAIVFDILGTASKSGFLERILFPFLKVNLENYINQHWSRKDFKQLYKRLLDQSIEFHKQEQSTPLVLNYELPQAKASLINFINFVTDNGINSSAVTHLRFKVWFEGYQQNKITTPIYSDVPQSMKKWFAEGIKFYVFSNTWAEAQKALLRNTNHGDMTNLIQGHYDNEFGSLLEPDSWRRFCNEIKEQPQNVLFLTKAPQEARAAADAGLAVVLVLTHRHNVKAVSHEDRALFPYVRTLKDIGWFEDEVNGGQAEPPAEPTVQENTQPGSASRNGPGQQVPSAVPTAVTEVTSTNQQRSTSRRQPLRSASNSRPQQSQHSRSKQATSSTATTTAGAGQTSSTAAAPSSSQK